MTGTLSASPMMATGLAPLWRHLGFGAAAAALMFAAGMYGGIFGWYQLPGFLPVALTAGLSGWAFQGVWSASIAPILRTPVGWRAELTRIPFWFMAGGMGAVTGLLIAKKCGILEIRDIPVRPLFTAGAKAYAGIQLAVTAVAWLLTRRNSR